MYQALYRKWRPRTFDNVVGQEHITSTLKNEIAAGRPSHAYLFCGTRGTGKTSCAKILAKAVNCPAQNGGNPCCECEICRGIDNDSMLDVTEIDAASNSGVDNIRDLREEANFTPAVAKYRVYIIDETHMLSPGAWAALLKIMEEPPAHVLFILATTEIHKVPATILSRCQRFDFKRIAGETIRGRLLEIAAAEDLTLAPDAALLIARLADGGMRDALSLLDLCATTGKDITTETVTDCAGLLDQKYLFQIAGAVQNGDSGAAFKVLEGLWEKSIDYLRLCEQLIGFFRNLMVVKTVAEPAELIACLPAELEEYKRLAGGQTLEMILYRLSVLQDALTRITKTSMRRTELEMALLRLASPELAEDNRALVTRIEHLELLARNPAPAQAPVQDNVKQTHTSKAPPTPEEIKKTPVTPFAKWGDALKFLKTKNAALHGALAKSKAYTGGGLLLIDGGPMFADMVRNDGYARESLREAVASVSGETYRLGPYNPEKYSVEQQPDPLDALVQNAGELGVDMEIR